MSTVTAPTRRLFSSTTRVHGLWIDGARTNATDDRTFDVRNPATGETIAQVASAGPADGLRALDAAAGAAHEWANTAPRVRGEVLRRAWELLQERRDDFAALITSDMGKPLAEAEGEVAYGGEFLRWFSEEAVRITGRYGPNPEGTGHVVVSKRPVGPALLITPWNFPLAMATRKIAPALAAGCTVVVKPAELTPLTTLALAELLAEAGVPSGAVNVIPTDRSREATAPVISDPRLRKLSFTGSTEVGSALLGQAAAGVLRTSMELGGNAPFVIFDDADVEVALDAAMLAKFRNMGQACTAANRFLVHESIADDFARRFASRVRALRVGPGDHHRTQIGPLINQAAVDNMTELVHDAVSRGARVLAGGAALDGPGHFFAPTVVTGLDGNARMVREEIFGPLAGIQTFRDESEAVALANDTEVGLAAYVFTADLNRAHRLIETIETGMMAINSGLVSNAAAPFGGIKQSGMGREGGEEGIDEYLETKYSLVQR